MMKSELDGYDEIERILRDVLKRTTMPMVDTHIREAIKVIELIKAAPTEAKSN